MKATEIRITSMSGIDLPDDATIGSELTFTARIRIHSLDETGIDVTPYGSDEPKILRGPITIEATAYTAEAAA